MKPLALVALLTVLLTGCSHLPRLTGKLPATAQALEQWQIKGRIGYSNNNEGGSANLVWQQNTHQTGIIDLSGPIGIGHAIIHYTPTHAELNDGKQRFVENDPTLLAWRVTGMMLPIPALAWWVRGLPWPDAPIDNLQQDDNHQLSQLAQAGWQLKFDRHQTVNSLTLPGRIKASKDNARFTLLISSWNLSPDKP